MSEQSSKEDYIRKICDKQTIDAMGILKTVNKSKHSVIEEKIISHFQKTHIPISFETYVGLVKNIDKEVSISFQRKSNNFGLDEIDDE